MSHSKTLSAQRQKQEAQAVHHQDRYVTSYQATHCAAPASDAGRPYSSANPQRRSNSVFYGSASKLDGSSDRFQTPNKNDRKGSTIVLSTRPQTSRKFGEYRGVQPQAHDDVRDQLGISDGYSPFKALQTGYEGGRQKRCTDRFVRYPYPEKMFSVYAQHHNGGDKLKKTLVVSHKKAFNMEKETKIINPHKMEKDTTNRKVHDGTRGQAAKPKVREELKEDRPIQGTSSYGAAFPDWKNGKMDVFHEKAPQYPYYAEPFRGKSAYANSFTADKMQKIKEQNARVQKGINKLQIVSIEPKHFGFETTHNSTFAEFKFAKPERASLIAPPVQTVQTKAPSGHFASTASKELKHHSAYKRSAVDFIPYP